MCQRGAVAATAGVVRSQDVALVAARVQTDVHRQTGITRDTGTWWTREARAVDGEHRNGAPVVVEVLHAVRTERHGSRFDIDATERCAGAVDHKSSSLVLVARAEAERRVDLGQELVGEERHITEVLSRLGELDRARCVAGEAKRDERRAGGGTTFEVAVIA